MAFVPGNFPTSSQNVSFSSRKTHALFGVYTDTYDDDDDGTLRLCTDFRKVNSITVPDPFPLPRIEDLLDRIEKEPSLCGRPTPNKPFWTSNLG